MTITLGLGKVTREVFNRCVLPFIPINKAIELDGTTTNLRGKTVFAHSPSIGVPLEALGFFAFHYSASNVACKFGVPTHIILGIYLPLNTSEKNLQVIAKSLGDEARKYEVTVIAGQTATYFGIEIPLITATCMGEITRSSRIIKNGDSVLLIGEVGGEAVWLDALSRGIKTDIWKNFTPLPAILSLQSIDGIKLLHDVSEGGLKGALFEIVDYYNLGLRVSSEVITYYPGVEKLKGDKFRAPSYGTFVIISESSANEQIKEKCKERGLPCHVIGEVTSEKNLIFDNQLVDEQKRTVLDKIYGGFDKVD